MDEADTGYSAYSILKTGLSQYGSFNLLALEESSGGTHPPLYIYLIIPLIKVFGLNIFVERIPSAIFGVLMVPILFLIVNKLFRSKGVAAVAALLIAVNPWAIHISRQGLLESIALFFVCLGTLLFLYASEKNRYLYILSAISFGLSLFSYDAPKVFLPPFILLLVFYKKDDLIKIKKYFMYFLIIFGMSFLLILKVLYFDGQMGDYNSVSIFDKTGIERTVNRERNETKAPLWLSSIFHNKATVALGRFETSYSSIFSLNWFFLNGQGNLQQSVAKHGQFHLFELPFFFLGCFIIFTKNKKIGFFLLTWILLGAIPGGITTGNYPYRSVLLLPVPIIFSSIGIVWLWNYIKKFKIPISFTARLSLVVTCIIFLISYLFTYFFDYPVYASESWAKQQNDALKYAFLNEGKYEKIFIDGRWESMFAFNFKIDPVLFQKAYLNQEEYRGAKIMRIGKFYFGNFIALDKIKDPKEYFSDKSLIITSGTKLKDILPLKEFKDPGGIRVIFNAFSVE